LADVHTYVCIRSQALSPSPKKDLSDCFLNAYQNDDGLKRCFSPCFAFLRFM
jgi:hypothetical protein